MTRPRKDKSIKRISLALQGGGAHGAFTWGALDRLLADERIEFEAISGASAGAVNAVVVADGLARGGRKLARERLEAFWQAVSQALSRSAFGGGLWQNFMPPWLQDANPAATAVKMFTQLTSPYVLNPLDYNPLRDIIAREVDFDLVHSCRSMRLIVSTTNVETGRLETFGGDDVTLDVVMASACLPTLFKAVEINGAAYWDGGYTGNPPLMRLIKETTSSDVLIVQINPDRRGNVPRSASAILNRLNEITFNQSLIREIEAVEFVNEVLSMGGLEGQGYRPVRLHLIGGGATFEKLKGFSKYNGDWQFLTRLRDAGHAEADVWLKDNFDALGD